MTPPSTTSATGQAHAPVVEFVQRFSSTPRGARLARRLLLHQLDAWGVVYGSEASETAAQLVAELAANAVTHGRVSGRDFEVGAEILDGATLRIAVSDARGELRPPAPGVPRSATPPLAENGRGMLLVELLADRWDVLDRPPVGKTVVAELDLVPEPPPGSAYDTAGHSAC
ncbi:ATP-binding protein [Streptomyces sp. NBC_00102]|uniref:ATP-binding protein n=1 Tax=Streptomyces sp. NBC_00102 TaxID=2975652 RepID=UPI00224E45DD|nr:ATP-binding protein [Streptomyces sp. NBC_00102]MCX5400337.1 ATP-binding protein [Streptomyces sp. NBC_00102]